MSQNSDFSIPTLNYTRATEGIPGFDELNTRGCIVTKTGVKTGEVTINIAFFEGKSQVLIRNLLEGVVNAFSTIDRKLTLLDAMKVVAPFTMSYFIESVDISGAGEDIKNFIQDLTHAREENHKVLSAVMGDAYSGDDAS